jgi:hypothetical protein
MRKRIALLNAEDGAEPDYFYSFPGFSFSGVARTYVFKRIWYEICWTAVFWGHCPQAASPALRRKG